ncbi:MAG: radical SAM protein [Chloroflexota bacterium]|nr:radical SAM protein [Chloroflexota bacterium]
MIREERCEITERYSVLPPYSLLQIGALLREQGHDVSLIDANGDNLDYHRLSAKLESPQYDALVFRFTPTTFDHDMKTAVLSKKLHPHAVTIGICWTLHSLPEQVIAGVPELDVYVRHEYETVTPQLIDALDGNTSLADVTGIAYRTGERIAVTEDAAPVDDYDSLPIPAYDLLACFDNYFINTPAGKPFTIMYTSKGCPYGCTFCTVARTKWKKRNAAGILEELRYLRENYGIKTVSFFDETFTIDRRRVLDIARGISYNDLEVKWYCNTRVELVDKGLLATMYRGGCRGVSFGVESGSQSVLDKAEKGSTIEQAEHAILWAKKAGIKVYCSFIMGLPCETWDTVRETIDFVRRTLPTGAQFNVATPYPGTKLFESVYGAKAESSADWRSLYQYQAVAGTDALSPEDLDRVRMMAYRSLYFNPRWWLQNIRHVVRHPEDFEMAAKYVIKIVDNYLIHRMRHGH